MLISSKGKYSLDGSPPPNEMSPGVLRYFAALFNELPFRVFASVFNRSATFPYQHTLSSPNKID